jgi:hypothetical protein
MASEAFLILSARSICLEIFAVSSSSLLSFSSPLVPFIFSSVNLFSIFNSSNFALVALDPAFRIRFKFSFSSLFFNLMINKASLSFWLIFSALAASLFLSANIF